MKNKMIVIMLSALLLCGCSSDAVEVVNPEEIPCFVTLEEYYSGDVIVDTRTGVEYWRSGGAYNHGTLTVLVDADGKPLICEEYKD